MNTFNSPQTMSVLAKKNIVWALQCLTPSLSRHSSSAHQVAMRPNNTGCLHMEGVARKGVTVSA